MVLKAKLEISCSSTTFIKEVFVVDEWIRNYGIANLHYQSMKAAPEPALARLAVADQPQPVSAAWRPYTSVGPAGLA